MIKEKVLDTWEDLEFWKSEHWQSIQEKLDVLDRDHTSYNPERHLIFASLDATPLDKVHVAFIGQDPYPTKKCCTGFAFSIPAFIGEFPPTLNVIFKELKRDLRVVRQNGDLTSWTEQGVLLWNAIPTCLTLKSKSHDWTSWEVLTTEIVNHLNSKGIVFILVGSVARRYASLVNTSVNRLIEVAHPSPRGQRNAVKPFHNSRIFSRCNAYLVELGKSTIDWSK